MLFVTDRLLQRNPSASCSCIIISSIIKSHILIKKHFFYPHSIALLFSTHFSYWNLFSINLYFSSARGVSFHLPLYYILMNWIFNRNPALRYHTECMNDSGGGHKYKTSLAALHFYVLLRFAYVTLWFWLQIYTKIGVGNFQEKKL